jgi:hypothetical protein
MSVSGAQFLAMACDMFSDERQVVIGMPDQTSGKSNVFDIRQEVTISRPVALSVDQAWDCHIALMPVVAGTINTPCNVYATSWDPSTGIVNPLAAISGFDSLGNVIQVVTAAQGDDTYGHRTGSLAPDKEYFGVQIPELVDPTQRARLISIGYEVVNETEELYTSGAITDYRVDGDLNLQFLRPHGALNPAETEAYLVGSLPPCNIAAAKQINGVTRAAKEGALVIGCYDRFDHEAEYPGYGRVLLKQTEDPTSVGGSWLYGEQPEDWGSNATTFRELPFLQSGSYCTNLSGQTKLRVVVHAVIEVFPAPGDPLMPLARDAPAYDPVAMEWLSQLQSKTLPGYPLDWNSSTKFTRALKKIFSTAREVAANVLPVAGRMLAASGNPRAMAAGGAMVAAGRAAKKK